MDASLLLARLMGPLFLAAGLGLLLNQTHYRKMLHRFLTDAALYYFSGALALTVGVAILLFHNIWVADWRVVITIIGWLSVLKGVVRLLFPQAGQQLAGNFLAPGLFRGFGLFAVIFGGWLCYQGYVV